MSETLLVGEAKLQNYSLVVKISKQAAPKYYRAK
jgi:hypothetical protein